MAENNNTEALGRRIFFLHPSAYIQNQITSELGQEEFETYTAKDENKLRRVLRKFPDSIVFANISDGMKENAWEEWIKKVMSDEELSRVDIGILSATEDDNLKQKYLEQVKVRCGFTVLKPELQVVIRQLVGLLNAANAKGRRKYVRAVVDTGSNTTVNISMNGMFIKGTVKDVSTVGFSCTFDQDPDLVKNSLLPDIQIRLATQLLKVEGIVFGSRMDGKDKIYVIILTQRTSPDVRTRIRKFIQFFLQSRMDAEFK